MTAHILWIDSESAQIFKLAEDGVKKHQIKKVVHDHHTTPKKDQHGHPGEDLYFHDICAQLKDADRVLVMGPGQAKDRLKSYIHKHHASDLGTKVVGFETSNHPTENQILAEGRSFFKKYDLFHDSLGTSTSTRS